MWINSELDGTTRKRPGHGTYGHLQLPSKIIILNIGIIVYNCIEFIVLKLQSTTLILLAMFQDLFTQIPWSLVPQFLFPLIMSQDFLKVLNKHL